MSIPVPPGAAQHGPPGPPARPSPLPAMDSVFLLARAMQLADDITLTLSSTGTPLTVTGPDGTVGAAVEALQVRHGEGPCLTAADDRDVTVVDDATTEQRWPHWTPAAVTLGIRAVLCVPLRTTRPVGSLNLWSMSARRYDPVALAQAGHLASLAAALIQAADRQRHLQRAVDGRTLIGQAQGVLIERYRMTPVDAFATLRRLSQQHNRKISDLAEELVSTGALPHLTTPARATGAA